MLESSKTCIIVSSLDIGHIGGIATHGLNFAIWPNKNGFKT